MTAVAQGSLCSPELLEDVLRERPLEADGIDSVIVVDNVPQVGPERLEKLKNVIHKIFSKFGKITNEFYPEADGKTKGSVCLCIVPESLAELAVSVGGCADSADVHKRRPSFRPQVHLPRVYLPYPSRRSREEC